MSLYAPQVPDYLQLPQSVVKYTYDPVGNRLSMENDEGIVYYEYNAADMLLKAGDAQYEYDKSGNLVTKLDDGKVTEYKYDARDLLREVDNPNSSYVKYGYDALGRKVYREEAQVDLNRLSSQNNSADSNGNANGNSNNGNGNGNANGNGNSNSNAGGNGNGNSNSNAGGNSNGNSSSNAGGNGNSNNTSNAGGNDYSKYNNPGQGNKYGIYKNGDDGGDNGDIALPLNIEAERYQYLGQTTILNKEYSDKGSPYAEYYIANNQVVSQKMFGLHGFVTPGKEESLKTTGGLMYYQYDRGNTVTELTDRHGDEIEHYRYDAFGNIFTGITSPYNTTSYTGQDYDDLAGLVQMDARWYSPSVGRFTSQDTYMGDMYSSQSLNRYSYVMNNPVNMWDPTGHVPEWVGDDTHLEISGDKAAKHILLSSSSSNSGWYNIATIDNGNEIIYKYQATITKTWEYIRYLGRYDERIEDYKFIFSTNVTYSQTDYYFDDVVVPASKIAEESEKAIQELVGNPPKNTDPPVVSICTLQVGSGPVQLLNPDQVIVQNTGKKTTGSQSIVTGAVQSVLNNLFNKGLEVDGWYGSKTAGAISEFQKEHHLTANGKLDVKTFYQLQSLLPKPKSIPTLATNQDTEGVNQGTGVDENRFFETLDDAAADFVLNNNPLTHDDNRERGTYIYEIEIEDTKFYTYFESSPGGHDNVVFNAILDYGVGVVINVEDWNLEMGTILPKAFVHTHPSCTCHIGEEFSDPDKMLTTIPGIDIVYLGTPDGMLYSYDKVNGKVTVSAEMPVAPIEHTNSKTK